MFKKLLEKKARELVQRDADESAQASQDAYDKRMTGQHKLCQDWDQGKAAEVYVLYKYTFSWHFDGEKKTPVSYRWVEQARGDLGWAERTAKHYGLEITIPLPRRLS
jgi:hypothetical protein